MAGSPAEEVEEEEESRHLIDVLTTQNDQLRECLKEVDEINVPIKELGARTTTKSPAIEISSAGLSAAQEQELRLLVAKFADSLGGNFDAKIWADGEQCFHLQQQQEADNVSSPAHQAAAVRTYSPAPEQTYRWCVEPDDTVLTRKMRVAAGMADNLFRTQCRCSSTASITASSGNCRRERSSPSRRRRTAPAITATASSLSSLMRRASLSSSDSTHLRHRLHTCNATSTSTISHLRRLGVYTPPRIPGLSPTSPLREEAMARRAAVFPWISIRLLYNLAQVHLLDVRLGLFRQALRRYSRVLEVSATGEEVRLRGWGVRGR